MDYSYWLIFCSACRNHAAISFVYFHCECLEDAPNFKTDEPVLFCISTEEQKGPIQIPTHKSKYS